MEIYIVKRVLSYVGCLAAVFIGGLAWLIMLYRGYIARHFVLTNSQEQFVVSAGIIGSSFCLPIAYLHDYMGAKWSMVTSITVTSLGLISIWAGSIVQSDQQPHYLVLALSFFIASMGSAMSFLTGITTALYNVTRRHKAMVCAILGLVYETSTQATQLLRRYGFRMRQNNAGAGEDTVMPRLTLTLLGIALLGGVISLLCIKKFQESREMDEVDAKGLMCAVNLCPHPRKIDSSLSSTHILQWKSEVSVWKLLATFEYQCVIWSSGLFFALAQFSRLSLPHSSAIPTVKNDYTIILSCVYSLAAILTRFPLACLVDTYNERLFVYMALLCLKLVGMMGHFMMFIQWNEFSLITFFVISGIMDGVCFFEVVVLTCQMFGYERLARNIGILLLMKSLFIVGLEYVHTQLTVDDVTGPDDSFCYGRKCEFGTSLVCLVLSVIGIVVFVPLIFIRSETFRCTKCSLHE